MELIDSDKEVLCLPTSPLPSGSMASDTLTIRNTTRTFVAFKVRTTNQFRYIVRPNMGVVPPHGSTKIFISLQPTLKPPKPGPSKDKFMVNVVEAPALADAKLTSDFWAHHANDRAVGNVKFKVEFGSNPAPHESSGLPESVVPQDQSTSPTGRTNTPSTYPSIPAHPASHDVFHTSFSLPDNTLPRPSLTSHLVDIDKRVLHFNTGPLPSGSTASDTVTVSNSGKTPVAFKIKTTNRDRYVVRPNIGIIPPHDSTCISIALQPSSRPPKPGLSVDRFKILIVEAPELPDAAMVHDFWTQHKHDDFVRNIMLKVKFLRYLHSPPAQDPNTLPTPKSVTKRLSETADTAVTIISDPKPKTHIGRGHKIIPRRRFGMSIVDVDKRVLCFPAWAPGAVSSDALTISNLTSKLVVFKMKTNNPRRYIVRPNMGSIPPHGSFELLMGMRLKSDRTQPGPSPDKFLLLVIEAPEVSDADSIREFWARCKDHDVEKIKFSVQFGRLCVVKGSNSVISQSGSSTDRQRRFGRLMTRVLGCITGVHSRSSRLHRDDDCSW